MGEMPCASGTAPGGALPERFKIPYSDGFAVAADGCRLYYNLSGSPDAEDKVLMVMGFACCRSYWKPQVSGPHKLDDGTMQVCTFDNRGVGLSDRPLGSHTALRLARDCLAIMQHVKWLPRDEPRGLQPAPPPMSRPRIHIVGWSLGGMIAQELALMMLDRSTPAATVTFACTHSGGWRLLPPPSSFPRILKLCLAMDTRSRIERVLPLHYRSAFLCQPACGTPAHLFHGHKSHEGWSDGEGTPTEQDCLIEEYKTRSPFKDSLLSYAPGLAGHLIAAARHFVSMDRLRRLGSDSRTRCLVVTAAQDSLIPAHHSRALAMAIGGSCEFVEFSENGHMVNLECFREFNAVVRHHIKRAAAGASARAGGDEEDLRRLLLNARCRRLVAVELSSAAEPWLLVHVVVGWLVRYALVIPVAMLMRLLTLLWKHAVAVRATIQHFFAVLCRYVAPSRGGGRFPGGRFHTWVFGVISKTSLAENRTLQYQKLLAGWRRHWQRVLHTSSLLFLQPFLQRTATPSREREAEKEGHQHFGADAVAVSECANEIRRWAVLLQRSLGRFLQSFHFSDSPSRCTQKHAY